MNDDVAARVILTSDQAEQALAHVAVSSRRLRAVTLFAAIATLAAVVIFGVIGYLQAGDQRDRINRQQSDTLAILHAVQDATDPNSHLSQEAQARTAAVVAQLIACVENHDDRLAALAAHSPLPSLVAGCPADSLSR